MASRLTLQTTLETILGSRNVYFQPPASVRINYPAIIYSRSNIDNSFANNGVYSQKTAYEVTFVDTNPDNPCIGTISRLPTCRFDSHYVADNLNHDVFTIFI